MDLQSAVALTTIPGMSRPRAALALKDLREHARDPPTLEDVIAVCCRTSDADVAQLAADARTAAAALLEAGRASGIGVIPFGDARYPPLLSAIADPPPVLWTRGQAEVLARPAVAIVGSRAATPYARDVAAHLGNQLARAGLTVVSGMARGAVVVIVSDGWEVGEPERVGREMARLGRLAHRIVWVNPRVSADAFSVRAGGMVAALPHCDALVSGHSFAALGEVAEAIAGADFVPPEVPQEEPEPWASATPVPGSSVAMPSGYGPRRGKTTPGWSLGR